MVFGGHRGSRRPAVYGCGMAGARDRSVVSAAGRWIRRSVRERRVPTYPLRLAYDEARTRLLLASARIRGRPLPPEAPVASEAPLVDFPVDAVFTWVDDTDPQWQRDLARARTVDDASWHSLAANESRYANRDELRYALRSLDRYAPWFRRVYLVTAGHRPEWLRTDLVEVVPHQAILDPSVLPTFNSHVIESALHHIDGLAEHYVYFNDDFLLGRPVQPFDFFTADGGLRCFPDASAPIPRGSPTPDDSPIDAASKNVRDLMVATFGVALDHKMHHAPYAQLRSLLFELEDRFAGRFAATRSHRVRHVDDLNVASALCAHAAVACGRGVVDTDADATYVNIAFRWAPSQLRALLVDPNPRFVCVNDVEVDRGRRRKVDGLVRRFLELRYPTPSRFERDG
jgi:hypothetical protein